MASPSSTPSVTPTPSRTPSPIPTRTPSPTPSSSPQPETVAEYNAAYASCMRARPTSMPERLGIGSGQGSGGVELAIDPSGLTWSTTVNSSIGGRPATTEVTSRFCAVSVQEPRPGTWVVRGSSTTLGPETCLVVARDFSVAPSRLAAAFYRGSPTLCPPVEAFAGRKLSALLSAASVGAGEEVPTGSDALLTGAGLEVLSIGELVEQVDMDARPAVFLAVALCGGTLVAVGLVA